MSALDEGLYDVVVAGEKPLTRSLDELKDVVFRALLESISNLCADDTCSGLRAYEARFIFQANSVYELSCTMENVANAYMALSVCPGLFY